ncbi:katanin p80 WD40 repeat-containing subunit B1 [Paragonimus westermani]|uniref:Katanin p80 WD40 repeat-containing subunit B1 n=1 Tax=Paragonimus westermani TaxID=34504 RepID=A0A5J4NQC0_9TREM|nr:katanin p80 WD40 repeat-containing subunit B1 [Paragonimus westermani]
MCVTWCVPVDRCSAKRTERYILPTNAGLSHCSIDARALGDTRFANRDRHREAGVYTFFLLWDVSRKGCINTYRGHAGGVNMVRFSPDGKWVVSSGEDGVVKLWDLSAGRQLAELTGHTGPVTAVAFHPTVLLLATASTDRTVRLFDLENFSQVAVSGTELAASAIRRIAFHPDGIYDYETMVCMETIHVGWRTGGGLDDMAIVPSFNQLVGASITNSMLITYVVDIKSCIPFVNDPPPADLSGVSTSQQSPGRLTELPSGSANEEDSIDPDSQLSYKPTSEDQVEMSNSADITDPEEYDRIFKPNRSVPRSPTRLTSTASSSTPFSAPRTSPSKECQSNQTTPKPDEDLSDRSLVPDRPKVTVSQPKQVRDDDKPFVPPSTARRTPSAATAKTKRAVPSSSAEVNDIFSGFVKDVDTSNLVDRPEMFKSALEPSESEWLSAVRKPHTAFMTVMSSRVENLSTVRVLWTRDNIRTAVETALMLNEPAVLVDILSVLSQNRHVETTCQAVHVILKNFAQLIRQTLDGPSPPGVDLVREESLSATVILSIIFKAGSGSFTASPILLNCVRSSTSVILGDQKAKWREARRHVLATKPRDALPIMACWKETVAETQISNYNLYGQ